MPTPEIPTEVRSKAHEMGFEAAVSYVWREAWGACTSVHDATVETSVETQIEHYWSGIYNLLADETSEIWLALAAVVEKLVPDIGPWDKREAVAAIVKEFEAVTDDA